MTDGDCVYTSCIDALREPEDLIVTLGAAKRELRKADDSDEPITIYASLVAIDFIRNCEAIVGQPIVDLDVVLSDNLETRISVVKGSYYGSLFIHRETYRHLVSNYETRDTDTIVPGDTNDT